MERLSKWFMSSVTPPKPIVSLPCFLPVVPPTHLTSENLGEVLRGDRIENSVYQMNMRNDQECKVLCKIDSLSKEQSKAFQAKIEDDYKVNMWVVQGV
jgi:hypothetical protein